MFDSIGFIGLGMMGRPMSKRLVDVGFQVIGYDIDPNALQKAKENGIITASSPKDVAKKSNPVIMILPDSEVVNKTVLGPDGILEGTSKGDILIDMTTAYPMSTIRLANKLSKKGVEMIDAPVSGGVVGAKEGTLSIIVGGDTKLVERCGPLFNAMGKKIFHMGAIGSGQIMKAINNFLSACSVVATSEALALATKANLKPRKVIDVLQESTGRSWATDWKFPKFVLTRSFDDGFRIKLIDKDLDILTRLAREFNVPMFIGQMVYQMYNFAMSQGLGEEGHTSIAQLIETWADVKIEG